VRENEEKQVIMHQTVTQVTDGNLGVMGLHRLYKTLSTAICWHISICKTAMFAKPKALQGSSVAAISHPINYSVCQVQPVATSTQNRTVLVA
jgi:hypothetical protein